MAHKLIPYSLLTVATLSGFNYSTHYQHPTAQNKPYVLLIHGFPSSAYDWRHQVEALSKEGYGIIAPDTIGYGCSSKPDTPEPYVLRNISDSLIEVVDKIAGNETKVHGVGHDWGSAILSRAANFHSDRFLSYTFMAGSYSLPIPFDIDAILKQSKAALGYTTLGYFKFFNNTESGPIVDSHQKSFADLLYPIDWHLWKYNLGKVGGLRHWLHANRTSPQATYLNDTEVATHAEIFAIHNSTSKDVSCGNTTTHSPGGYSPPLNIYRAAVRGLNNPSNALVKAPHNTTNLPTLFVGGSADLLAVSALQCNYTALFAKKLTCVNVNGTGHWVHIEKPEEVNAALVAHFERVDAKMAANNTA